ncbi:hypothetical protein [Streptomyces sp. 1222.5]|uniref:hypothetical protein n=1 Tax=Streptomyces sp. 1222.5 TaxID=1881026 RepID=UPI003EBC9B92
MADEDSKRTGDDEPTEEDTSQTADKPPAVFRMELRDTLPGGKAIIGLEREGEFVWLGSRKHITEQARDEFEELCTRIVEEQLWVQNWPGR